MAGAHKPPREGVECPAFISARVPPANLEGAPDDYVSVHLFYVEAHAYTFSDSKLKPGREVTVRREVYPVDQRAGAGRGDRSEAWLQRVAMGRAPGLVLYVVVVRGSE